MPVLLRTGAGSRQPVPVHRPSSQTSVPTAADNLRVQQQGRKLSKISSNSAGTSQTVIQRQASRITTEESPKRTCGSIFKLLYRRYHIKRLFPLIFIILYMCVGAVLFYLLENSSDQEKVAETFKEYKTEKEMLVRRVEEIYLMPKVRKDARRKMVEEAVTYFEGKVDFKVKEESQWDLMSAMYFSGTLFTTIGYGDIACETAVGRIATVIYSCIGIPLMLITLNDLGKFLYSNITGCVRRFDNAYLGVLSIFKGKPTIPPSVVIEADAAERGEISSLASEAGSEEPPDEEFIDDVKPRMSVTVALGITVSWIFICASLFRLWEDWTYGESLYFMFISLSTIGLGDVAVEHRDMMVLCFVFVIVGLSLVSMSINVVQVALEDFYCALIMKLITEYQAKLAADGDHVGASMGMMKMFGNNRTAKFLMPLLSKEKKRMAMDRVEVEAKKQGLEVPGILTDFDEKTGMPKLLKMASTVDVEENAPAPPIVEQMVQKQILEEEEAAAAIPLFIAHDADTQTEILITYEKTEQTEGVLLEDNYAQTEVEKKLGEEMETQTISIINADAQAQTNRLETNDAEMNTFAISLQESTSQTEEKSSSEQEVQTYIVESMDAQVGTEIATKNIRIQTPQPVIEMRTVQTDDLGDIRNSPSKLSSARRRLRRAFAKKQPRSADPSPAMSDWKDVEESNVESDLEQEEGSVESLHWDPVDGLHAEKQLPVARLKSMFETNSPVLRRTSDSGRKTSSFTKKQHEPRMRKCSE